MWMMLKMKFDQVIAEYLDVSANTVKTHVAEAVRKLHIKNRKGLKIYTPMIERSGKLIFPLGCHPFWGSEWVQGRRKSL